MKVEDWVIVLAENLKNELESNLSQSVIDSVAQQIEQANLTASQKEFVWNYFSNQGYDKETGTFLVCFSDHSEFLKLVAMIKAKTEKK